MINAPKPSPAIIGNQKLSSDEALVTRIKMEMSERSFSEPTKGSERTPNDKGQFKGSTILKRHGDIFV